MAKTHKNIGDTLTQDGYFFAGTSDKRTLIEMKPAQNLSSNTPYSNPNSEFEPWGENNDAPQQMLLLCQENANKMAFLMQSRDLLLGKMFGTYNVRIVVENAKQTRIVEPIEIPEITDWLEAIDYKKYNRDAAFSLKFSANIFSCFGRDASNKITDLKCLPFWAVRSGKYQSSGLIDKYALHANWQKNPSSETIKWLPNYQADSPQPYFLYHSKEEMAGNFYYPQPAWWGTKTWTEVDNLIPKYHKAGLENGYNIKYHMKLPSNYFQGAGDAEKQEKAKKKFRLDVDNWLKGVDNADKTLVTFYFVDASGRAYPGVELIAMENQMTDEAYLKLHDVAKRSQSSGHRMSPQLAFISEGGSFGASGSELRSLLDLYLIMNVNQERDILLEAYNLAFKINGWSKYNKNGGRVIFGFEDQQLTTLAENKSGKQNLPTQQN